MLDGGWQAGMEAMMAQHHGMAVGYGLAVQVLFVALAAAVVWWVLKGLREETPEGILKKRLARGELSVEEYRRLRREVGGG